jgi:hypothetical protein
MKLKLYLFAIAVIVALFGVTWARPVAQDGVPPKIAWYCTLKSGLAEAARSHRPILLISAAPQCLGVSGTW